MGDDDRHEAPPLHLGDYPHGAYWSADREDAKKLPDNPGPPPWVTTDPRSPANPYPLRMFGEVGCNYALWVALDEPPPTTNGAREAGTLEEELPISASLRVRLLAWGRDYGNNAVQGNEFDERGYHLSRELILELGDLYSITYSLTYAGPHRRVLRARARSEPLPRWQLKD